MRAHQAVDVGTGAVPLGAQGQAVGPVRLFAPQPELPDDFGVSTTAAATATTSPWVPVIAASLGAGAALFVGVLTQWGSSRREKQRWDREREDRQEQWLQEAKSRRKQWQQERRARQEQWQREDSLRWHQELQQAYARLMAALDEWDRELLSVVTTRIRAARTNEPPEIEMEELTRLGETAGKASALVQLMAPETVGSLAEAAIKDRQAFRITYLELRVAGLYPNRSSRTEELRPQLAKLRNRTSGLRDAIRGDLGIESNQGDTASSGDIEGP